MKRDTEVERKKLVPSFVVYREEFSYEQRMVVHRIRGFTKNLVRTYPSPLITIPAPFPLSLKHEAESVLSETLRIVCGVTIVLFHSSFLPSAVSFYVRL